MTELTRGSAFVQELEAEAPATRKCLETWVYPSTISFIIADN